MITIEILETGEIQQVTRNVAHGLIDSGRARLANRGYKVKPLLPTLSMEDEISLPSRSNRRIKPSYRTK